MESLDESFGELFAESFDPFDDDAESVFASVFESAFEELESLLLVSASLDDESDLDFSDALARALAP